MTVSAVFNDRVAPGAAEEAGPERPLHRAPDRQGSSATTRRSFLTGAATACMSSRAARLPGPSATAAGATRGSAGPSAVTTRLSSPSLAPESADAPAKSASASKEAGCIGNPPPAQASARTQEAPEAPAAVLDAQGPPTQGDAARTGERPGVPGRGAQAALHGGIAAKGRARARENVGRAPRRAGPGDERDKKKTRSAVLCSAPLRRASRTLARRSGDRSWGWTKRDAARGGAHLGGGGQGRSKSS